MDNGNNVNPLNPKSSHILIWNSLRDSVLIMDNRNSKFDQISDLRGHKC